MSEMLLRLAITMGVVFPASVLGIFGLVEASIWFKEMYGEIASLWFVGLASIPFWMLVALAYGASLGILPLLFRRRR